MKQKLQRLGKSLMQPVAVLPLAALLMGVGYWIDPQGWGSGNAFAAFFIKSGAAILDNLGLIFAVGVAFGLSKDKNGASALAGLVAFLTMTTLLSQPSVAMLKSVDLEAWKEADKFQAAAFDAVNNKNVLFGILAGVLGSAAYNKFYQVKLPDALAFFSGRRLTPIMASFYAIIASIVLFFVWPIVYVGLVKFGNAISKMGPLGAGLYAFFNRLLIPTGLHHALNSVFWFDLVGINDIGKFWNTPANELASIITDTYYPGMYQAGFFPIMMFGLPGAALAMYKTAKPEKKQYAKSLLLAGALASFLTGVTEPLEFSFMFLAPGLYLVHALFTGISVAIVSSMKIAAGFGFSAGLIDYILSLRIPAHNKTLYLIPIGLVFFALYYFVFRAIILKKDLKTPGREDDVDEHEGQTLSADTNFSQMAKIILEGLGGSDNIDTTDYCITRLRLEVKDHALVDEDRIKEANVSGIVRPSQKSVQVIIGPQVQAVYDEFIKLI